MHANTHACMRAHRQTDTHTHTHTRTHTHTTHTHAHRPNTHTHTTHTHTHRPNTHTHTTHTHAHRPNTHMHACTHIRFWLLSSFCSLALISSFSSISFCKFAKSSSIFLHFCTNTKCRFTERYTSVLRKAPQLQFIFIYFLIKKNQRH